MKRFKHLLIVLAEQTPTDALLSWASLLGRKSQVEKIDILCIEEETLDQFPNQSETPPSNYSDEVKATADQHLKDQKFEVHLQHGSSLKAALDMLSCGSYDLVLTSLHDAQARVLAERLARKSPAGVLALPANSKAPPATVITAIDFSSVSPLCIEWAEAFSTLGDDNPVRKEAIHAMKAHIPARAALTVHETDLKQWARDGAEEQMHEILNTHASDKTTWHPIFIESTFPAFDLMDRCEKTPNSLLIIGSHGRNAFSVAFLGNQACEVIRNGRTPVLVTKRKNDNLRFLRELLGISNENTAN